VEPVVPDLRRRCQARFASPVVGTRRIQASEGKREVASHQICVAGDRGGRLLKVNTHTRRLPSEGWAARRRPWRRP
jgi:hypothetical protein